jgi:hypothetical protein
MDGLIDGFDITRAGAKSNPRGVSQPVDAIDPKIHPFTQSTDRNRHAPRWSAESRGAFIASPFKAADAMASFVLRGWCGIGKCVRVARVESADASPLILRFGLDIQARLGRLERAPGPVRMDIR